MQEFVFAVPRSRIQEQVMFRTGVSTFQGITADGNGFEFGVVRGELEIRVRVRVTAGRRLGGNHCALLNRSYYRVGAVTQPLRLIFQIIRYFFGCHRPSRRRVNGWLRNGRPIGRVGW
jgi:hypothetical protein